MSKLSNAIKQRFKNLENEKVVIMKVMASSSTQTTQETKPQEIRDAHMQRFKLSHEIKNHRLAKQ